MIQQSHCWAYTLRKPEGTLSPRGQTADTEAPQLTAFAHPPSPPYCSGLSQSPSFIQIADKHKKRCSASLIIRELQIKISVGYHLSLVRMPIIKMSANNKCWRGCGENGAFFHCWWEGRLGQPLWRTAWRFLKNLGIELPYDPAIPLLGIHTEETRIEETCVPQCSSQHCL